MSWILVNALFELVGCALAARGAMCERVHGSARLALGWSGLWALQCVPYYLSVGDGLNAWLAGARALALLVWVVR